MIRKSAFSESECPESEILTFNGHENVLGFHVNTLEFTMDDYITKRADCIIGVNADKGCAHLNDSLKKHIQSGGGLKFELKVGQEVFIFFGRGSSGLNLQDAKELVIRKSYFESPRTVAIRCNAAAVDVPRQIVEMLKNPKQKGTLKIAPEQIDSESVNFAAWPLP